MLSTLLGAALWKQPAGRLLGGDAHGIIKWRCHSGASVSAGFCLHRPSNKYKVRKAHSSKAQVTEKCWWPGTATWWSLFSNPPPNSFNLFNNQIIKTRVSCNQLLPCLCLFQVNSCSHYGALYPWLILLSPTDITSSQHLEALHKLQVFSKVCFDCMDSIQLSP